MMTGLRFSKTLPIALILTACCVALLVWCSDPEADQRARFCKRAGMKPEVARECRRSQEDFNRIMEPIRARQHREEGADFNAALQAVPLRSIPKDRNSQPNPVGKQSIGAMKTRIFRKRRGNPQLPATKHRKIGGGRRASCPTL